MNFKSTPRSAFTLIESLVAMAVVGIMVISLYAGITSGLFSIRLARENLRATQILVEKMEVIRLCTWDQISSNGFIPTTFTAPYYAGGATNGTSSGPVYDGRITISSIPSGQLNAAYNSDLRLITVKVSWKTLGLNRDRKLNTYVSRYGMQNYVFN